MKFRRYAHCTRKARVRADGRMGAWPTQSGDWLIMRECKLQSFFYLCNMRWKQRSFHHSSKEISWGVLKILCGFVRKERLDFSRESRWSQTCPHCYLYQKHKWWIASNVTKQTIFSLLKYSFKALIQLAAPSFGQKEYALSTAHKAYIYQYQSTIKTYLHTVHAEYWTLSLNISIWWNNNFLFSSYDPHFYAFLHI